MNEYDESKPLESEDEDFREIKQLEKSMDGIIRILKVAVREASAEYWAPHAPQFLYTIDRFQNRCRDEIKRFGEWREDGREPDEVIDMLDDECERLHEWLTRMILPMPFKIKTRRPLTPPAGHNNVTAIHSPRF